MRIYGKIQHARGQGEGRNGSFSAFVFVGFCLSGGLLPRQKDVERRRGSVSARMSDGSGSGSDWGSADAKVSQLRKPLSDVLRLGLDWSVRKPRGLDC